MQYKPRIISAKPLRRFAAANHTAVLFGDVRVAGMVQYVYLLMVYQESTEEPLLIVSAEVLAGGPDGSAWDI